MDEKIEKFSAEYLSYSYSTGELHGHLLSVGLGSGRVSWHVVCISVLHILSWCNEM